WRAFNLGSQVLVVYLEAHHDELPRPMLSPDGRLSEASQPPVELSDKGVTCSRHQLADDRMHNDGHDGSSHGRKVPHEPCPHVFNRCEIGLVRHHGLLELSDTLLTRLPSFGRCRLLDLGPEIRECLLELFALSLRDRQPGNGGLKQLVVVTDYQLP